MDSDLKIQINDTFFKEELAKFPPIFQYLLTKETFMIDTEFLKYGMVKFKNNELKEFIHYDEEIGFIFISTNNDKSIYKTIETKGQNYHLFFNNTIP